MVDEMGKCRGCDKMLSLCDDCNYRAAKLKDKYWYFIMGLIVFVMLVIVLQFGVN